MNSEILAVLNFIQDGSAVLIVCWIRIWVIFKVVPFFGGPMLPTIVRNVITISLAFVLYPLISSSMDSIDAEQFFWFVGIIAKESFVGFLIGYIIGMFFWAIGGVGFFIDNQRGASMASSMNPMLGDQDSPIGIFLTQVLVTLLFVSGGILELLDGIYKSYVFWPPTSFYPLLVLENSKYFLLEMDNVFLLIVLLSAPVVVCMFISEFGLALIGRFAPQLNVFFLAMPIKSGISIAVLILYMHVLMEYVSSDYVFFRFIPDALDGVLN